MNFFHLPDKVIYELMDGDQADLAAEAEGERRFHARGQVDLSRREADRRVAITKTVSCPGCGEDDLFWTKDAEGEDCLAYAYGALRSRLHTCE